jgi:hypothetical protein
MLKSLLEGIKLKHPCDNEGLGICIGFHENGRKCVETEMKNITQSAI